MAHCYSFLYCINNKIGTLINICRPMQVSFLMHADPLGSCVNQSPCFHSNKYLNLLLKYSSFRSFGQDHATIASGRLYSCPAVAGYRCAAFSHTWSSKLPPLTRHSSLYNWPLHFNSTIFVPPTHPESSFLCSRGQATINSISLRCSFGAQAGM